MVAYETVVVVLFGFALAGAVLLFARHLVTRRAQPADPNGCSVPLEDGTAIHVPSAAYIAAMRTHVEAQRVKLRAELKPGELPRVWAAAPPARRRRLLLNARYEVRLAVASFIGDSEAVLGAACPELADDGLERLGEPGPALEKLLAQVAEARPLALEPNSAAEARLRQVEAAVAARLRSAELGTRQERDARATFVSLFRRSCLAAFGLSLCAEAGVNREAKADELASCAAAASTAPLAGGQLCTRRPADRRTAGARLAGTDGSRPLRRSRARCCGRRPPSACGCCSATARRCWSEAPSSCSGWRLARELRAKPPGPVDCLCCRCM